jgi:hypothetical protein
MENNVAKILHNLYNSALMSKDFTTYHGSLKIVCTLVRGDLHKYYLPDNKGKLVSISEDEAIQFILSTTTLLENNKSKVVKEGEENKNLK